MNFLLDANTYIEAKNRYYRMNFCPGFWDWLDLQFDSGQLCSISMVYDELSKSGDELSDWVKARKSQFIPVDDAETQSTLAEIVQFVAEQPHFKQLHIERFLNVADPWLIAKAKTLKATLVTHEVLAPSNTTKVKIPNICQQFDVPYCDTFHLLDFLQVQLILQR